MTQPLPSSLGWNRLELLYPAVLTQTRRSGPESIAPAVIKLRVRTSADGGHTDPVLQPETLRWTRQFWVR